MKSFKTFVTENPVIDPTLTKNTFKLGADHYRQLIHKHIHPTATHIGNNHYTSTTDDDHLYYRHDGTKIHEISTIEHGTNIQNHAEKHSGSSEHIHEFMKYHAKKFGSVKSDSVHTPGSKKLWKDLIKSNSPGYSFHHITKNGISKINKDNIKDDEIWGNDKHHSILEMKHDG